MSRMKESLINGFQVLSNGERVWVNGPDGCSVARFSITGIDVHRPSAEQAEKGPCLDCQPGPMDEAGWQAFLESVEAHYDVKIPDKHKPEWLKDEGEKKTYPLIEGMRKALQAQKTDRCVRPEAGLQGSEQAVDPATGEQHGITARK